MTILSKLQSWPTVAIQSSPGLWEEIPKPFGSVASDGRSRFMRENGGAPDAILIGPAAKLHLQEETANLPMKRMTASEIKLLEGCNGGLAEYMGMTIHWTFDEGLHLMRD